MSENARQVLTDRAAVLRARASEQEAGKTAKPKKNAPNLGQSPLHRNANAFGPHQVQLLAATTSPRRGEAAAPKVLLRAMPCMVRSLPGSWENVYACPGLRSAPLLGPFGPCRSPYARRGRSLMQPERVSVNDSGGSGNNISGAATTGTSASPTMAVTCCSVRTRRILMRRSPQRTLPSTTCVSRSRYHPCGDEISRWQFAERRYLPRRLSGDGHHIGFFTWAANMGGAGLYSRNLLTGQVVADRVVRSTSPSTMTAPSIRGRPQSPATVGIACPWTDAARNRSCGPTRSSASLGWLPPHRMDRQGTSRAFRMARRSPTMGASSPSVAGPLITSCPELRQRPTACLPPGRGQQHDAACRPGRLGSDAAVARSGDQYLWRLDRVAFVSENHGFVRDVSLSRTWHVSQNQDIGVRASVAALEDGWTAGFGGYDFEAWVVPVGEIPPPVRTPTTLTVEPALLRVVPGLTLFYPNLTARR